MVSIKKNSQGRWPLADVKSFCRGQALRGRRRVFLLGFGRSVSHFILPSTISVRAISAVLNPAISLIRGRLPPEFSWRTRREIRLTNTLGLPTSFNAFSLNSAFKIILFSQKGREIFQISLVIASPIFASSEKLDDTGASESGFFWLVAYGAWSFEFGMALDRP